MKKTSILLLIFLLFTLTLCMVGAAAAQTSDDAAALLRTVAQRTKGIQTLHSSFVQEKNLAILNMPLVSSGQMCVERSAPPSAEEKVFWIYEKPAPSGFSYTKGQGYLWTGKQQQQRPAQGAEAAALKAVTAHILAWVQVRPELLEQMYRLERVTSAEASDPVLRLYPRQENSFFAMLEVTFSSSLDTVRQLRFVEKNADSTRIRFNDTRINAALPPVCQSTGQP